MKNASIVSIGFFVAIALSTFGCGNAEGDKESDAKNAHTTVQETLGADWLFVGDNIVTMTNPDWQQTGATALAVKGERISWIGDAEAADAQVGSNTRVVELGDQALLPGFIDAHGHVSFLALTERLANIASPPVGPVTNMADLIAALKQHRTDKAIPVGEWIVGMGYDDSLIAEGRHPTRDDLDKVSTEHPVGIVHVSGHLMAANSMALKIANITADSDDPAGGIIRRRASSNEPDGVLEETAAYPLRALTFTPSPDPIADLDAALKVYAGYGVTTVQDGAASEDVIKLLTGAAAANKLWLDVMAYPVMREPTPLPDSVKLGEYVNRFKLSGIKMLLDGSPQGKTAYLTKPYHVPPHGQDADYRGYPTLPVETVNRTIHYYIENSVPIIAHANGDAAADMLIGAVDLALTKLAQDSDEQIDHRTVMIHAQTVREDQLDEMAALKIIPSYFAAHSYYWGDWHRDSVLGEERGSRISPTASTVARDMVFTVHNDAPIVPPDMLRLLWATTNRETRSGKILGEEQRISIYKALEAVTRHAAVQSFEEANKGTLEVGKLADLVVLSKNPLLQASDQLMEVNVEGTWSHGKQVFEETAVKPL